VRDILLRVSTDHENREGKGGDRDVFNERPTREDQSVAVAPAEEKAALATSCTIHTSMGDIVCPPNLN